MQEKMAKLKKYALAAICLQIIILAVFRIGLDKGIMTASIIIIFESVFLYYVFDRVESLSQAQSEGVSDILGKDAKEAYLFGQTRGDARLVETQYLADLASIQAAETLPQQLFGGRVG